MTVPDESVESFGISEPYRLDDSEETRFRIILSSEVPLPDTAMAEGQLGPFIPKPPAVVILVG